MALQGIEASVARLAVPRSSVNYGGRLLIIHTRGPEPRLGLLPDKLYRVLSMSKTTVGNPATTPTAILTTATCRVLAHVAGDDELDDELDDVRGDVPGARW